jgi:UDP-N-acetylmuramoylalanine--D-glutamate ligase
MGKSCSAGKGRNRRFCGSRRYRCAGAHNVENVLAASAAACLVGADPAAVAEGVRSFAGVEHRLEFVRGAGGVEYYNDSKATNVDATRKALEAFSGNVILILGGKDKGSDYTVLSALLRQRARLVLLIGAAAEKIASQIGGAVPLEFAGTLDRAVEIAAERARPGDTVLLAPRARASTNSIISSIADEYFANG